MNTSRLFQLSLLLVVNTTTSANCPEDLPIQELIDCVTVEGSGQLYEDYLAEITALEDQISTNKPFSKRQIPASNKLPAPAK